MLLFVSEWSLTSAVAKLGLILKSPPAKDELSGNIIGLNPYHDYALWSSLKEVENLVSDFGLEVDPSTAIKSVEIELKQIHQDWRDKNPSMFSLGS